MLKCSLVGHRPSRSNAIRSRVPSLLFRLCCESRTLEQASCDSVLSDLRCSLTNSIAEHKPFGKDYIRGTGRTFKFDDGESLEDVRGRANEA